MRTGFRRAGARCAALLIALALGAEAAAAGLEAHKIGPGRRLQLSGKLDDPLWQEAPEYADFWETRPTDGARAPVRTTARILYDATAIYIGIKAHDPAPGQIRAPLVRRDNVFEDQDYVGIFIDPIGAGKAAMFVRVNAQGVIADGLYTADTGNLDFSPDFDSDARAAIASDGYSAEIRIPFSMLRYTGTDARGWQVQVVRSYPRALQAQFASVPLAKTAGSQLESMNAVEGLHGLPVAGGLSFWPSVTAGAARASSAPGQRESRRDVDAGVDIKWRPGLNWVVDATIKPDFSQVELDVPQLTGNAQFPLLLPEKRPFFLESSDILEAPTLMGEQGGGGPKALYTRSITQPSWGVRATGRDDASEGTLLLLKDSGGGQVLIPRAYSTDSVLQAPSHVLLARTRTHRQRLSLGALLTRRDYLDGGGSNTVVGSDAVFRSDRGDRVRAIAMVSDTSAQPGADGKLRAGAARQGSYLLADWIRKGVDWEPSLTLQRASEDFRNDTGFFSQSGFRQATAQLQYKTRHAGAWSEINPYVFYVHSASIADGATIMRQAAPGVWLNGPYNTQLIAEYHPAQLQRIKAGGMLHSFEQYYFQLDTNPAPWLNRLSLRANFGKIADVGADRAAPGLSWLLDTRMRLAGRIELEPRIEQTVLRAPNDRISLRETALRVLLVYHIEAGDSVRAIAQRNTARRTAFEAGDAPSAQSRRDSVSLTYAHRWSSARVWYLGASYGATTSSDAPRSRVAELFTKLQFAM